MTKFRFRYAMCIYIDAETEDEAVEIFENMDDSDLESRSEYVDLEDVSAII